MSERLIAEKVRQMSILEAAEMINLLVEQGYLHPLQEAQVGNLFTTSVRVLQQRERLIEERHSDGTGAQT
jgi:hypothetical protein